MLFVAAFSYFGSHRTDPQTGDALVGSGPPSEGVLGFPDAKVGSVYRFAFPLLENHSKSTLVVESIQLDHVPAGAKVLGYAVYTVDETNGYILDYQDGDGSRGTPNMETMHSYAGQPITIRSHAVSDSYGYVAIKVVGHITQQLTGCRVNYRQGSHYYTQELHCEYALDM